MNNKLSFFLIIVIGVSFYLLTNPYTLYQSSFISFQQFKKDFNKTYSSPAQQSYRKIIFNTNQNLIQLHNSDPNRSYKLGITQFTDLTEEQFVKTYLNLQYSENHTKYQNIIVNSTVKKTNNLKNTQNDIDWVSRGNVLSVRNQGICGSCWAFSTSSAVESLYSIYKGQNTYLSPQQLIDCSTSYGNNGCNGGRIDSAFAYIKDHGLSTEKQYPYISRQQGCRKDNGNYRINNFASASECSNLFNALQLRPVSVAVDASTWALYKQGILTICGRNLNHGALLVGAADGYWKIKNSWGSSWGQNGYIRIARGNTCGVCETPFYPIM